MKKLPAAIARWRNREVCRRCDPFLLSSKAAAQSAPSSYQIALVSGHEGKQDANLLIVFLFSPDSGNSFGKASGTIDEGVESFEQVALKFLFLRRRYDCKTVQFEGSFST
ncbi:hypothetical protein [Methylobacter sp.]|uniref:hypothetical protein n=1 Tax=Methylobacter sp. TaxID=2051955 RepID=UPI003DA26814